MSVVALGSHNSEARSATGSTGFAWICKELSRRGQRTFGDPDMWKSVIRKHLNVKRSVGFRSIIQDIRWKSGTAKGKIKRAVLFVHSSKTLFLVSFGVYVFMFTQILKSREVTRSWLIIQQQLLVLNSLVKYPSRPCRLSWCNYLHWISHESLGCFNSNKHGRYLHCNLEI